MSTSTPSSASASSGRTDAPKSADSGTGTAAASSASTDRPLRPPSANAQYAAAQQAAAEATARSQPSSAKQQGQGPGQGAGKRASREAFADIKWAWSRKLKPPHEFTHDQLAHMVLKSPHVLAAIDRVTFESTSGASATKEDAAKAAKAIFEGMYADINDANVRTAIYFMRKVWRTMYEGIRVNESGIAMLHEYAAQRKPVVLLPMHKSHVDYLLLSYVCTAYNLYPPHIIAGDNLSMPIVGNILKHGGGVFIRRVFGSDELYKTIFAEYIATLIKNGHMLECFIEGTRSRMGKLKTPKIGFLSVLVDLLLTGRLGDVEDVMLVPIAISYDKVIEGSTYVSEMLGATKRKESLTETLNSVNKYIRLNFGSIDVSICEGISLRDSLAAYASAAVPNPAEGASLFLQYTQNEQKRIIMGLAHKICWCMNLKLVISPTSIVATVLLTNLNRGIARKDIITRAEHIKKMILSRGGSVAHIFHVEPMAAIVDRALKVLGKLLQEQHSIVYGTRNITSLELSIYRNQLLHFFVNESLMCVSMAAEHKDVRAIKTSSTQTLVDKSRLIDSVRFISQLLKFEFIYKGGTDMEDNFDQTLEILEGRGVLKERDVEGAASTSQQHHMGKQRSVSLNSSGVDDFLFLSMLIWPFIETYWIAIASLFVLLPDVVMESKKLAEVASRRAEALYYSGHVEFYECLNTESIMNAYEWCISQGILRVHMVGSTRMMQLTPEYQFAPEDSALSTNPVSRSTSSDAPAAAHPSSAGSTPQVVPSLTKRHTSLDRASSSFHASSSSAASNNVPRKSLRDLVMRVGRFRKIRLVATDSSKSLLEAFVDDLCATADQTPAVMTTPVAVAATTAAANVQKLLKSRL